MTNTELALDPFYLYKKTIDRFNESSLEQRVMLLNSLVELSRKLSEDETEEELLTKIKDSFPDIDFEFAFDLVGLYLLRYRFKL